MHSRSSEVIGHPCPVLLLSQQRQRTTQQRAAHGDLQRKIGGRGALDPASIPLDHGQLLSPMVYCSATYSISYLFGSWPNGCSTIGMKLPPAIVNATLSQKLPSQGECSLDTFGWLAGWMIGWLDGW